jgi:DNA-binding SARP family transcriptional activator
VVDAEQLRMTDAELRSLWRLVSSAHLTDDAFSLLVEVSGRHPALAALVIRHWAMADGAETSRLHPDAAYLIRSLVDSQLAERERHVLDYAAVIATGTASLLAQCMECADVSASLARAATVLPVVAVSESRGTMVFSVHQMVAEALGSASRLAARDSLGFDRMLEILAARGEHLRALALSCRYGADALVVRCLEASGESLLAGGHQKAIADALQRLPAVSVASDARLLLLDAECRWEAWNADGALRIAELALRVAEADSNCEMVVRSRMFMARIRSIRMEHEGVVAEVQPLLLDGVPALGESARADAAVAMLLAHTFLGDRAGLRAIEMSVCSLEQSPTLGASSFVRLVVSRGLSKAILDGDWPAALDCFVRAQSRAGSNPNSMVAEGDALSVMLQCGLVAQAGNQAARALSLLGDACEAVPSLRVTCAASSALCGSTSELSSAVESAVAHDAETGDPLSMTATLIFASDYVLATRDHDSALSLADRGIRAAMATGSPVLLSLAELAQSMALAAAGDDERAAQVARRLLPWAESLEAWGHVLRARFVLAVVAFRSGDLAGAVEHLSSVSDYIIEKSPALMVATFVRAFPEMLGPLALAMGVEQVPVRVLNLLPGVYGQEALQKAAIVLTPAECARLAARMRAEAAKVAQRAAAADLTGAVCRVRVLGRMEVVAPHAPVADRDWCKRKARLLFAMLVVRSGTDVPRGEIIEYLWPEMDEDRALNNFYVVWSAMKRALAPDSVRESPCPFVEHVHGVCRVVPGRVVTDLDEFDAHLSAARRARERGDAHAELAAIRAAEQVYRGDVLPGDIYDDWFAPVRSRYRHEFEDAMLRAAQLLEDRGEPHEGLSLLRRPMDNDTLREDFYQAALRLQIAAGQRSAAIETYMSCRSRLVEDLGIDPSRETTALYEQVLGMEDVLS